MAPAPAPYPLSFQGPHQPIRDASARALAALMERLVIRGDYGRTFDACLEMGNADDVLDLFLARCDASAGLSTMVDPFYFDLVRARAARDDRERRRAGGQLDLLAS